MKTNTCVKCKALVFFPGGVSVFVFFHLALRSGLLRKGKSVFSERGSDGWVMSQQEIAHMAWNCSKPYGLSAWLSLPMINHYHHSLQEHLPLLEPSEEVKENWASLNFSHPNPGNNKKEVCSPANTRSNSNSPHDTAGGHGNLNDTTHCNKKDTDEELVQLARGRSWWYTIPDVNQLGEEKRLRTSSSDT